MKSKKIGIPVVFTTVHAKTTELWKLVEQMTKEFQAVKNQVNPMGTPWTLREVMTARSAQWPLGVPIWPGSGRSRHQHGTI